MDAFTLIKELTEENEMAKQIAMVKADTVQKMHDMIKERCVEGGIYPAFVARTIDNVAKEMLEEGNGKAQ
jgi:hypothetical protein